jgi:hypothetical protein
VHLVAHALQNGASMDQLERFMAMQVAWEQREAEKAFNAAVADFKLNPPEILKSSHVHYQGAKSDTDYWHAGHYDVTMAIVKALAVHGLSHSWKLNQDHAKSELTVTCTLKHKAGHSEFVSMQSSYDPSGGKNAIQAIGSAKTYMERYTLLAITGLSTKDAPDDDGASADVSPATVEAVLQDLLNVLKKADTRDKVLGVWHSGKGTLGVLSDRSAHDELKAAVESRLAEWKAQP